MRSYLVLVEKARRWNADAEIRAILSNLDAGDEPNWAGQGYTPDGALDLGRRVFDRRALGQRGLAYERLDQLTFEVLTGAR